MRLPKLSILANTSNYHKQVISKLMSLERVRDCTNRCIGEGKGPMGLG